MDRLTLPTWVRKWGEAYSLDKIRIMIRRNPALSSLRSRVGATRIFSASDAAKIRAAYDRKNAEMVA
jgi:hypothetical protein